MVTPTGIAPTTSSLDAQPREPLRVMFLLTSMPVGGAETLLVNLVRRMDRARFRPGICCLKERGELGESLAGEMAVHSRLLSGKYDLRVLPRLARLLRRERTGAVVTVGAGDKMFWGRLAARLARVPVAVSALHSTGWPDGIGRLNRLLTPLTDGFIAVAEEHRRYLVHQEGLPEEKVHTIPNGVDVHRFAPLPASSELRDELDIPETAPLVGIVAALRPEKNHRLFLQAAARVQRSIPEAHFLIVGDGPLRPQLEQTAADLQLSSHVHFLGTRPDVPAVLSMLDVFALSSDNEANPVSILEAMAMAKPVVATQVGSVAESVVDGTTGYLVKPGDPSELAGRIVQLLQDPLLARSLGQAGRECVVRHWSLERMVEGYERLIEELHAAAGAD